MEDHSASTSLLTDSQIPDISLRPGVEVVQVKFGDLDPMSVEGVQNYEDAIADARNRGVTVKALILCSPHNPLGRCYSRSALMAYLKLCAKYQIHLISDEIYALSVWDNTKDDTPTEPFTSILSIASHSNINPALVHVLWGMSKDFGANGLRLGCIISQHNEALREAMKSIAIYSYASSLSDHVASNILENTNWTDSYIVENRKRLSEAYSHCVDFLKKNEISYALGANAAFFLWVDLGKSYSKRHGVEGKDVTEEVMEALLQQKVYLASGAVFGSETPGVFRIVFSHPRDFLDEGLRRVARAIEVGRVH